MNPRLDITKYLNSGVAARCSLFARWADGISACRAAASEGWEEPRAAGRALAPRSYTRSLRT